MNNFKKFYIYLYKMDKDFNQEIIKYIKISQDIIRNYRSVTILSEQDRERILNLFYKNVT